MSVTSRAPDFDVGFVRTWFARHWLAIWFGSISLVRLSVLVTGEAGFDARLYLRATRAWLDGQDPWITVEMQRFAVPVLWPSTKWYYSTLAMPALTSVAAALMAVPVPGFAVVAAAIAVAVEHRRTSTTSLVADWKPGILGRP